MSPLMIRVLYLGMLRTKEDNLYKLIRPVSSLASVGLLKEVIVVMGLPLNVVTVFLGCIFSALLSDFKAQRLRSVPTPHMTALTGIFQADAEINVHTLPE